MIFKLENPAHQTASITKVVEVYTPFRTDY